MVKAEVVEGPGGIKTLTVVYPREMPLAAAVMLLLQQDMDQGGDDENSLSEVGPAAQCPVALGAVEAG